MKLKDKAREHKWPHDQHSWPELELEEEKSSDLSSRHLARCGYFLGKQGEALPSSFTELKVSDVEDIVGKISRVRGLWRQQIKSEFETNMAHELLRQKISDLGMRLSRIENAQPFQVTLNTLTPRPYRLRHSVSVTIKPSDGEFIASLIDANINTTGDTEHEAIENLKDIITDTFSHLRSLGKSKLGPGPMRTLSVLEELILYTE